MAEGIKETEKEKLTRLCQEAVKNPIWQPIADNPNTPINERTTFCNMGVNYICSGMGYTGFKNMLANEMVKLMETSNYWERVSLYVAQDSANEGRLVILGIVDIPHGHVAVVIPGHCVISSKWGDVAPQIANIGTENTCEKTANWIFTTKPRAWRLKE